MALVHRVRIELERYPDFGRVAEIADVELAADDADDRVWVPGQRDALAEDVRVARETLRPEVVADDGGVARIREVLLGREPSPHDERRSKRAVVLGAGLTDGDRLKQVAFPV